MFRNLFLCFTPYHIKVSNWLIKNKLTDHENYIILSLRDYKDLITFLSKELYKEYHYYHLNYRIREVIRRPIYYKKLLTTELSEFINTAKSIDPDFIYYFSDNPIPYQILLKEMKNKGKKTVFVEEGLAFYTNEYKFNLKEKIYFNIGKYLFNCFDVKLYPHGQGNLEDIIIAREPELKKSDAEKIKIKREDFIEIFKQNYTDVSHLIKTEKSALLCPAGTTYSLSIRNKVYEDIFKYYVKRNKKLYVKLHPSERHVEEVRKLVDEYKPLIELIERNDITSEDIILCNNIDEVISDMSSSLVNAYYLRSDIEIYTYVNYLKNKYKVRIPAEITIFNYLREKQIIKDLTLT